MGQLHVDPNKLSPAFTLLHLSLGGCGAIQLFDLYKYIHLNITISFQLFHLYLQRFHPYMYVTLEIKIPSLAQ